MISHYSYCSSSLPLNNEKLVQIVTFWNIFFEITIQQSEARNACRTVCVNLEIICLACPVSGLPQDSNALMTTGDYINGQSVKLQCNAGYVLDAPTTCTCDTTGANPTWKCDPNNVISCVASK